MKPNFFEIVMLSKRLRVRLDGKRFLDYGQISMLVVLTTLALTTYRSISDLLLTAGKIDALSLSKTLNSPQFMEAWIENLMSCLPILVFIVFFGVLLGAVIDWLETTPIPKRFETDLIKKANSGCPAAALELRKWCLQQHDLVGAKIWAKKANEGV